MNNSNLINSYEKLIHHSLIFKKEIILNCEKYQIYQINEKENNKNLIENNNLPKYLTFYSSYFLKNNIENIKPIKFSKNYKGNRLIILFNDEDISIISNNYEKIETFSRRTNYFFTKKKNYLFLIYNIILNYQ